MGLVSAGSIGSHGATICTQVNNVCLSFEFDYLSKKKVLYLFVCFYVCSAISCEPIFFQSNNNTRKGRLLIYNLSNEKCLAELNQT